MSGQNVSKSTMTKADIVEKVYEKIHKTFSIWHPLPLKNKSLPRDGLFCF